MSMATVVTTRIAMTATMCAMAARIADAATAHARFGFAATPPGIDE
jgi:hypothetical protein